MIEIDGALAWMDADLTPVGMTVPDSSDEDVQSRVWLQHAAAAFRGQSFLYWSQLHGIGEFLDLALARLSDAVDSGGDQRDLFDPYSVAVSEVGVIFAVSTSASTRLLGEAIALTERLPKAGLLLRDGLISPDMFSTAVRRTDIVEDAALLEAIDEALAKAFRDAGHISAKAAERMCDRVVAQHDPDAVRRREDKAERRKNVSSRNYGDGLGGLNLTDDAEEIRLSQATLDSLANAVCGNDPRTLGQRRAAAASARLQGRAFTCGCDDPATCTAELDDAAVSARQARIVIHAICQKTALDEEESGESGFLDGHGPVSNAHLRRLRERPDTQQRDLDLGQLVDQNELVEIPALIENTSQPADPYRPTTTLDTLARALFGACTVPGCDRAAWSCELDHCDEFNQLCPASGGPTCLCNVGPKCKLHHLLKTHLNSTDPAHGWLDDQWIDDAGQVWTSTTIRGITVDAPAENLWLFPQLTDLRCMHQSQAPPAPDQVAPVADSPPTGGGLKATTAYKHAWRRAARARLRRIRDHAAEADGPPPF